MMRTVAAMDVRMATALAGAVGNVAEFCRAQDISRTTYYKWQKRFAVGGVDGLAERSRRPLSCPTAIPVELEEQVVRLRKELSEMGADHGPDPIRWALLRADPAVVPSRASIARILVRRGLVVPEPSKRPKSSLHRFVYARPNECWQSDWTHYPLTDGTGAAIAGTLDDHSRLCVGLDADLGDATAVLVWAVMTAAVEAFGIPVRSLTDNGTVYSGARRGIVVPLETNLRALSCQPICSRPFHPQTCGKIERFWQTLKPWLRAHGPYDTVEQLRAALVAFQTYYNHHRPHRALHGATPAEAFAATTLARPASRPLPAPVIIYRNQVHDNGTVDVASYRITVGRQWEGHQVTSIKDGDHIAIFSGNHCIRELDADPTRKHQPLGHRPPTRGIRQPRPAH
jgi:transposase InsO family protein